MTDLQTKKSFSFGGDDEPEDQLQEEEREELEQDLDPLPDSLSVPDGEVQAEQEPSAAVDLGVLNKFQRAVSTDPELAQISSLSRARFHKALSKKDFGSRVSRGWLNSLTQRHFFLALSYPGLHLEKLLSGHANLAQIRLWVNGLETMPSALRHILMLEHLLDRRTMASREKMPTKNMIEKAMAALRDDDDVSSVLGGFEGLSLRERESTSSPQLREGDMAGMQSLLGLTQAPAERYGGRRGATLPLSRRGQGKGRPLGKRLLKPDSYCYNIARKSRDAQENPRITPQQAMELVNKAAEMERQYQTFYSLRRKDPRLPWTVANVDILPTEELERQRSEHLRHLREEDS